ncbi:Hexaprenyldihydroxybenzoate methyltransferase, mitochondrial [Ceratocystis pirilliformis]|uniref:Ubiquinone biosynthesis O-methyltransferase, mitochondrial n=1 Tax=Ceratocystis pirilliformis TaxID=259994 RepID=A0ABR3YTF7_9PEZI
MLSSRFPSSFLRRASRTVRTNTFQPATHLHRQSACLQSSASSPTSSTGSFSSIDPCEISHFNKLASSWWDPHGPSRILHLMNPLRHDFMRECHASQPEPFTPTPASLRYLDIGCGGGIFAESAARLPTTANVLAIDPTPEVLAIAQAHSKCDPMLKTKLQYRQATIEDLPLPTKPEEQFDVVSIFEVVEHVDNPAPFLDRAGLFVKPGGWLVMSTIARTWISWFTTNLMAEDILKIVPKGTHDWNKYLNHDEMTAYFSSRGIWEPPQIMGVMYVPGIGWKRLPGSENLGNYFIAVRKAQDTM